MVPQRILFIALSLALSMALATSAQVSQNAMARSHQAQMQARYAAGHATRALPVAAHKRMAKRKATAAQRAAQEKLNQQNEEFHAQNDEWQQAAIASLKQGKTPQSFDEYWSGKSGSGSTDNQTDNSETAQTSQPASKEKDTSSPETKTNTNFAATSKKEQSANTSHEDEEDDCEPEDEAETANPPKVEKTPSNHAAKPKASNPVKNVADAVGGLLSGQGTYYAPGLGACGWTNSANERIVAISHSLFDSFGTGNPNNNPACGKRVKVTYKGKTTEAKVVDRCEGCAYGDLDFTETGFQDLAGLDVGRLSGLSWSWVGGAPNKA